MSDDPPPPTHVESDVGIPSGWGASVASDMPAPVEVGTIRLSEAANRAGGTIEERTQTLREKMVDDVLPVFRAANLLTLVALGVLALLDEANLYWHLISPGDRVITSQVIMALLGATTVQVGAIAVIIAQYLFPGRPR